MKKISLIVTLTALLQGCTGFTLFDINTRDVKGQNVDVVVSKIKSRGFSCGKEYKEKAVNSNNFSGSVDCGTKGSSPICPTSHSVFLVFDLETRKVLSVTKDERDNCF
jgi:hypothetical protein